MLFSSVSVGNPHAVAFVDPAGGRPDLETIGPAVERNPLFPAGANVELCRLFPDKGRCVVDVWERGAGVTRACGSGACAVLAAARARGLLGAQRELTIEMPGGALQVEQVPSGHVHMTGPATRVFDGEIEL